MTEFEVVNIEDAPKRAKRNRGGPTGPRTPLTKAIYALTPGQALVIRGFPKKENIQFSVPQVAIRAGFHVKTWSGEDGSLVVARVEEKAGALGEAAPAATTR